MKNGKNVSTYCGYNDNVNRTVHGHWTLVTLLSWTDIVQATTIKLKRVWNSRCRNKKKKTNVFVKTQNEQPLKKSLNLDDYWSSVRMTLPSCPARYPAESIVLSLSLSLHHIMCLSCIHLYKMRPTLFICYNIKKKYCCVLPPPVACLSMCVLRWRYTIHKLSDGQSC